MYKRQAFVLFCLAGVTDYFDGYFARIRNEVSSLGTFLDPIADKLLVAAVILILTSKEVIADWETIPALIILLREIVVSGLREYLAGIKVSVPVSKIAKFNSPIGTGEVMGTNKCQISICKNRNKNKVIIISAIDNLIKGASGQAVQNMNVAFNLKETAGLI